MSYAEYIVCKVCGQRHPVSPHIVGLKGNARKKQDAIRADEEEFRKNHIRECHNGKGDEIMDLENLEVDFKFKTLCEFNTDA